MKEYGGYLPLELPLKSEYFSDVSENDIVRLDCGRSAIWYAINDIKPSKIYVPYFNCKSITDHIDRLGIRYEFYYVNEDLLPVNIHPRADEAVIWINYYGNAKPYHIDIISKWCKITNLIIDNCHAFFCPPVEDAYNCYSTRKFFGVSDGAYLIKNNIKKIALDDSTSSENMYFLMACLEYGTNVLYAKNIDNENRLGRKVYQMSKLTRRILQSIDYDSIKQQRRDNFIILHSLLKDINEFCVNLDSTTHMCYPLLIMVDGLRDNLIKQRIYVPTLWRHVPEYFRENKLETKLSQYMLILPIDQRYKSDDMHAIATIVRREYEKLC